MYLGYVGLPPLQLLTKPPAAGMDISTGMSYLQNYIQPFNASLSEPELGIKVVGSGVSTCKNVWAVFVGKACSCVSVLGSRYHTGPVPCLSELP